MPTRICRAAALFAAASLVTTPLAAAEFPRGSAAVMSGPLAPGAVTAHDRWDGRHWRGRDRLDSGDVVAGVLVIGAIAAIASAASRADRDRDYRYPQSYPRPYPDPQRPYDYRSAPADSRYDGSQGLDRAVDTCVREIERDGRVDTVDGVDRSPSGWRVAGRLANGGSFTCSIGDDGRIEALDRGSPGAANDSQWDDERYAAARQAQDGTMAPAYPGGPVDGDGIEADDDYSGTGAGRVPAVPG